MRNPPGTRIGGRKVNARLVVFGSFIVAVALAGGCVGVGIAGVKTCPAPVCATTTTTTHSTTASRDDPTLRLSAKAIEFGKSVRLGGAVPGAGAGIEVQIYSQPCGFTSPVKVASVKTRSDGTYAFSMMPTRNATYFAHTATGNSGLNPVAVEPSLTVRRAGSRAFAVDVSVGAGDFFSKSVSLQRYDARRKAWRTVGSGMLHQKSDTGAIVAVSSATIHAAVKPGTTIRASVGAATLGKCYRPGHSVGAKA
jgi:hypothetical protein